jgi:hypothetical protein
MIKDSLKLLTFHKRFIHFDFVFQEKIRRAEEEKIEKQKNFKARAAIFSAQGKGV